MLNLEKTIIVTGHYGSGKTNLSLNLALKLREEGEAVTLADLDVVNPYFRTADFGDIAKRHGIELLASDYANSNLDIPALSGGLDAKINSPGTLIIDAGGDDAGAFALGRYAPRISAQPYSMLYVINAYRYLMKDPRETAELLSRIETASRLKATHIANCSNLGFETKPCDIIKSLEYAESVSEITGLPLIFTAVKSDLAPELISIKDILPVSIYVRTPWNLEKEA